MAEDFNVTASEARAWCRQLGLDTVALALALPEGPPLACIIEFGVAQILTARLCIEPIVVRDARRFVHKAVRAPSTTTLCHRP